MYLVTRVAKYMKVQNIIAGVALGVVGLIAAPQGAMAAVTCPNGSLNTTAATYAECNVEKTTGNDALMPRIKVVINVVLGIVGLAAVVMIILGGINFITSQGDAAKVTKAKNTVLYGIIGLVIALLAFAIVNFVLGSVFGGTTGGSTGP